MRKWLWVLALCVGVVSAGTTEDMLDSSSDDDMPIAASSTSTTSHQPVRVSSVFKPLPKSAFDALTSKQQKLYRKRAELGQQAHLMVGHKAKAFAHEPCILHGRSTTLEFKSIQDRRMILLGGCFIEEGKIYKISVMPIEADGDFQVDVNSTGLLRIDVNKKVESGATEITIKPDYQQLHEYEANDKRLLDKAAVRLWIFATKFHPRTPTKANPNPGNAASASVTFRVEHDPSWIKPQDDLNDSIAH